MNNLQVTESTQPLYHGDPTEAELLAAELGEQEQADLTEDQLEQLTAPQPEEVQPAPTNAEIKLRLQGLEKMLEELLTRPAPATTAAQPKNKAPGQADPNKSYTIHTPTLPDHGKVPQQQRDLADIISKNFETDKPIPEAVLFATLEKHKSEYPSLAKSVQDVAYLFKYYRGLKAEKNHAGFVARGFLSHN